MKKITVKIPIEVWIIYLTILMVVSAGCCLASFDRRVYLVDESLSNSTHTVYSSNFTYTEGNPSLGYAGLVIGFVGTGIFFALVLLDYKGWIKIET